MSCQTLLPNIQVLLRSSWWKYLLTNFLCYKKWNSKWEIRMWEMECFCQELWWHSTLVYCNRRPNGFVIASNWLTGYCWKLAPGGKLTINLLWKWNDTIKYRLLVRWNVILSHRGSVKEGSCMNISVFNFVHCYRSCPASVVDKEPPRTDCVLTAFAHLQQHIL